MASAESFDRLKAQQVALDQAEAELGRAARHSLRGGKQKTPRGSVRGQAETPRSSTEMDAERVGRAVANHLGQGFHGMVRHHL